LWELTPAVCELATIVRRSSQPWCGELLNARGCDRAGFRTARGVVQHSRIQGARSTEPNDPSVNVSSTTNAARTRTDVTLGFIATPAARCGAAPRRYGRQIDSALDAQILTPGKAALLRGTPDPGCRVSGKVQLRERGSAAGTTPQAPARYRIFAELITAAKVTSAESAAPIAVLRS
jgi:hypothetical protein